ncbi:MULTISPECIES: PstS family phosphate ABC transporter substrate-binding protein [Flavobacterium]|uniref:Phosphate ABC transporter substrate-binding protein n=1 Tax=Flavobacterium columnare TaxID=996 RepID=A0AA94JPA9_9FLAO|nr:MULTISPECIES: substrate-binding domain-containing protein [Flavobacterium]MCH4830301.1 substrate-binding domain-containing protein [Flavobacterium columnare]MCH4832317.1 substrate-binding domain-containing protein [Flavobacterium columnare]OWP86699.1 phosphate ABC transporter substrate-binding protein [Flavobacterium covae]
MKLKHLVLGLLLTAVFFVSCYFGNKDEKETILTGTATILVDETVFPLVEDHQMIFENQYQAKIKLIPKPEKEIIKLLSEGKNNLAILTRELTLGETKKVAKNNIKGKITDFAIDGIAFIGHPSNSNFKIEETELVNFLNGKPSKIKKLIFDNANSSTVRYLMEFAKVKNLPKDNIFALSTNNEVITFISKTPDAIGVVGINWITQPMPDFQKTVENIKVLELKTKNGTFVTPSQDLLASGNYPYSRKIKILNYQGTTGLGMGFASFIAGELGQRIVLKSGLVPVRMPSRNIIIRKEVEEKEKNN